MEPIFCCNQIQPYRPQRLLHESKFAAFLEWARNPGANEPTGSFDTQATLNGESAFVIQAVRQINFGSLESKRYFVQIPLSYPVCFKEIAEDDLITANYEKLNSYKNFKCSADNKFFELNVYQRNPVNKHHWHANIARPAGEIDLK